MTSTGPRTTAIALTAVALVGATATAVAGFVLTAVYQPDGDRTWGPGGGTASGTVWSDVHRWATNGFLVTSAAVLVIVVGTVIACRGRSTRLDTLAVGAAGVAVASAVATALTRPLVEWSQLALRSVTVGTDIAGYGTAAFDDEVLFVLVDGVEVSPGTYAAPLVVHLAAPVIGAAALALVLVAASRSRSRSAAAVDHVDPASGPRAGVPGTGPASWSGTRPPTR